MVAEAVLQVDGLALGGLRQVRSGDVVLQPPTDVLRPRQPADRPPGVLLGLRLELPAPKPRLLKWKKTAQPATLTILRTEP